MRWRGRKREKARERERACKAILPLLWLVCLTLEEEVRHYRCIFFCGQGIECGSCAASAVIFLIRKTKVLGLVRLFSKSSMQVVGVYVRGPETVQHPVPGPPSTIFLRQRISDRSVRIEREGIVESIEWHRRSDVVKENGGSVYTERAVLVQTTSNYARLAKEMPSYFAADAAEKAKRGETTFAENLLVELDDGLGCSIGDTFAIENRESNLLVEISCPRKPCSRVDGRNGSPFGLKGVRRYSLNEGLSGFFFRVLSPGCIKEGDRLVRVSSPHPQWTIARVCKAVYGSKSRHSQAKFEPEWSEDEHALNELAGVEQLGHCEWGEFVQRMAVRARSSHFFAYAKSISNMCLYAAALFAIASVLVSHLLFA